MSAEQDDGVDVGEDQRHDTLNRAQLRISQEAGSSL